MVATSKVNAVSAQDLATATPAGCQLITAFLAAEVAASLEKRRSTRDKKCHGSFSTDLIAVQIQTDGTFLLGTTVLVVCFIIRQTRATGNQ